MSQLIKREQLEEIMLSFVFKLYDENDIEIDGNRYHHKGYYENDTGYGEPAGEFYYGEVTASTSVNILITVS